MSHLEQYNVLNNEQHGFRKGRSCETQLALTVNDLAKILDNKGQADVIIMDFDLVPHQRLLYKLTQAGITGPLHKWASNFLTKRILGPRPSTRCTKIQRFFPLLICNDPHLKTQVLLSKQKTLP